VAANDSIVVSSPPGVANDIGLDAAELSGFWLAVIFVE
jgi:hypothetical protein